MKRVLTYVLAALLTATGLLSSCKEKYITYDDAEYVMFADTAKVYAVREDMLTFEVPVVSTVARNYDRTFAVEILDPVSSAVEGRDFVLESNNFTIPAGELTSSVKVTGNHENLSYRKDLSFTLRLVMDERLKMPLHSDETIVRMKKTCKFNRDNFTGWAVVTSMFLYEFSSTGRYQRLIQTSADPHDDRSVILHGLIADGFDITISFDEDTDPVYPAIHMKADQVASDEAPVFGTIHGDNHILMENSNQGQSYFFSCQKVGVLINRFYVKKIGEDIGTVGHFLTEIDWISDEEAMRLKREEGM